MRRFVLFSLILVGICAFSSSVPAQNTKKDTKKKDGTKKENPDDSGIEWPKEIEGKNLGAWLKEMKDAVDPSAREEAIRTVFNFGPEGRKAAGPNLQNAITSDKDLNVRIAAIQVVPLLGFDDDHFDPVGNTLVGLLRPGQTSQNIVRMEVLKALSALHPAIRIKTGIISIIPTINEVTSIDQTSWQVRQAAAIALGNLGQGLPPDFFPKAPAKEGAKEESKKAKLAAPGGPDLLAIRTLTRMIDAKKEHSHLVRRSAMNSLVILGPPHELTTWNQLRTALLAAMKDPDKHVVMGARVAYINSSDKALERNDPVLEAIGKQLESKDPTLKAEALQALGILGDLAHVFVPDIVGIATQVDVNVDLAKELLAQQKEIQAEYEKWEKNNKDKKDKKDPFPKFKDPKFKESDGVLAISATWVLSRMKSAQGTILPVYEKLEKHKTEAIAEAAKNAHKALLLQENDPGQKDLKKKSGIADK